MKRSVRILPSRGRLKTIRRRRTTLIPPTADQEMREGGNTTGLIKGEE
ncbi:MAG: hypothetical protein R3D00_29330 [Bacteroidia bacterium]